MCGICGFAGFDDPALLRRMTAALCHRGPDSDGFFASSAASLGFRRLNISDLEGGQQTLAERGWLAPDAARALLRRPAWKWLERRRGSQLFLLLTLELYCRLFIDPAQISGAPPLGTISAERMSAPQPVTR